MSTYRCIDRIIGIHFFTLIGAGIDHDDSPNAHERLY